MVGPDSYVLPFRQLEGLNMETGMTPEGKRPIIEKSDQVYSNILDGTADDREIKFPLRAAYEKAMTEVKSVSIPPPADHAVSDGRGQSSGSHAAQPFCDEDPGMPIPPPPAGGEVAPVSDPDESDDDGPGGWHLMTRLWK